MKILYAGISAKYVHTMPAGWFLAEYLASNGILIEELYHNVNEPYEKVLQSLLSRDFDTLLVSVYIFNVEFVKKLVSDVKCRKQCAIIAGGPEVDSFFPADYIVKGEGEKALLRLLKEVVPREIEEELIEDLDTIPSPYTSARLNGSGNKLIYYESSRGCPFRCAYCTAGLTRGVRYFSIDRVKADLRRIASSGAKTVKFTDRTFNMDAERTDTILAFIKEEFGGNGICFHFEVGGDLFKESTLKLLQSMPRGLVQLEAGVQTFNEKSLKAVIRTFDSERFVSNMKRIIDQGNIHTHIDLIAGLPYDTLATFKESFDRAIRLRPHMLQLGFLKMLKGTPLRQNYDAVYCDTAPYEVISTPYMTEEDFEQLKRIEQVVNRLYNSGKFFHYLDRLFERNGSEYQALLGIADFLAKHSISVNANENEIYGALLKYCESSDKYAKETLRFDYLITNNSRRIPAILKTEYSASFKKFTKTMPADRNIFYAEMNYLPDKDLEGFYILKFDYSSYDRAKQRYCYDIVES